MKYQDVCDLKEKFVEIIRNDIEWIVTERQKHQVGNGYKIVGFEQAANDIIQYLIESKLIKL